MKQENEPNIQQHFVIALKGVHHRQKLTTDFFQTFRIDNFGCEYLNFEKKKCLPWFKGLDNKIIGFVHI